MWRKLTSKITVCVINADPYQKIDQGSKITDSLKSNQFTITGCRKLRPAPNESFSREIFWSDIRTSNTTNSIKPEQSQRNYQSLLMLYPRFLLLAGYSKRAKSH